MAVRQQLWPSNPFPAELKNHHRHLSPSPAPHDPRSLPMTTVLPPIASFDAHNPYLRQNSLPQPFAFQYEHDSLAESLPRRLPPIHSPSFLAHPVAGPSRLLSPELSPLPQNASTEIADWFSNSYSWSSPTLAEKTCEMICYLWFSKAAATQDALKQTSPHLSYKPHRSANTAHLQFSVSSVFINFMHKLLQTTQLSQSVIVLSLHYVYRLKARNGTTVPSPGSEFRVAVAGLMMANKFVDDNTYTNKTWSEVSGIELSEINKMEREFLAGINFELYVDKQTYEAWVNLLKGLVLSKERDSRYFRKSRQARVATVIRPTPIAPLARPRHRNLVLSPRARSSSPIRALVSAIHPDESQPSALPTEVASPYRPHGKRTAIDAFSPTSASFTFERPPAKRPTGLALDIPQVTASHGPVTPSPLESIPFSKLSLGSSPAIHQSRVATQEHAHFAPRHVSPQTLIAAYRLDPTKPRPAPQTLYFYSLAGSPLAEDKRSRKGHLHYHQPPSNQSVQYSYASQPAPVVVQSAHASPHERVYHLPPVLPHPHDGAWTQPRTYYEGRPYIYESNAPEAVRQTDMQEPPPSVAAPPQQDMVRSAPFANAGPPGIQYYPYPAQPQVSPDQYWVRGRRP